jgi:hypothetical protein
MEKRFEFAPGDENRLAMGCVIRWKPYGWIVTRTLEGSPAAAVGVTSGDSIKSVNGVDLLQEEEINILLRRLFAGEPTSKINLQRGSEILEVQLEPVPLAQLIEIDWAARGEMSYCFTCRMCFSTTDGWYECGSGGCSDRCSIA